MNWEMVKLGDVCKMNSGGTPSRSKHEFYGGDILWAKISDIESSNGIIYDTDEHITQEGLASINNRIFKKGTLFLAMYGSVGKVAFAGTNMSSNQAILGIRINDESLLNYSYLKNWFTTIKEKLLYRAVGGTLQNISLGIVKDLQIPLPPLSTQKRIVEILDKADALRKKDQQLLKYYDDLAQSLFIDLFGDPVKNEKGWEVKKLGELGNWKSGGTPSRSNSEFYKGNIPWLSSGELNDIFISTSIESITEQAIKNSSTSLIPVGSLLLGMYDTAALKSSINKVILSCNQAIAFSHLDKRLCNVVFVYYLIQIGKEEFKKAQRGVRQKNLNLSMIKDIKTINPPISLQNQFATQIQNIEQQKEKVKAQIQASEHLFQALLQQAFNGGLN